MRIHQRILLAAAALTLAGAGLGAGSSTGQPHQLLLDPLETPWVIGGCEDNRSCPGLQHKLIDGTEYLDDHDSCLSPEHHMGPDCDNLLFRPGDVSRASPQRLAEMLAVPGSNVYLNRVRRAVQVYGCNGGIIAHIPLQPLDAEALLSAD